MGKYLEGKIVTRKNHLLLEGKKMYIYREEEGLFSRAQEFDDIHVGTWDMAKYNRKARSLVRVCGFTWLEMVGDDLKLY